MDKRGNENEGEVYFERYNAFLEAFTNAKAANPELYDGIELIYSSGAFDATNSDNHKRSVSEMTDTIYGGAINVFLGEKEDCVMEEFSLGGFSESFNFTAPAYSVTSIRLKRG